MIVRMNTDMDQDQIRLEMSEYDHVSVISLRIGRSNNDPRSVDLNVSEARQIARVLLAMTEGAT